MNIAINKTETDLNNSSLFLETTSENNETNGFSSGSTIFDVLLKMITQNDLHQTETFHKYNNEIDKLGKNIEKLNRNMESIETFLQPAFVKSKPKIPETTVSLTSVTSNHSIEPCKQNGNKQCTENTNNQFTPKDKLRFNLNFRNLKEKKSSQLLENNSNHSVVASNMHNITQKTMTNLIENVTLTDAKKSNAAAETLNVKTPELVNKEQSSSCKRALSVPRDCFERQQHLKSIKGDKWTEQLAVQLSGVHQIWPDRSPAPFMAYCDFATDTGGWTVLQTRTGQEVDFYRNYAEYRQAFGNIAEDHWLGLESIHLLTNQAVYELLIQLESFEGETAYARYGAFAVGGEAERYQMAVLGEYSGTAGDAMRRHAGMRFTTFDQDSDLLQEDNCAVVLLAAWWFRDCAAANLNGQYLKGYEGASGSSGGKGVYWADWAGEDYSLKTVVMKVRPVSVGWV